MLEVLRPYYRASVPIVGLEPSCVAALRDELPNLLPNDWDAKRLTECAKTLGEFLHEQEYEPPKLHRKAVLHGHCHHLSIMGMDGEKAILDKMELDYEQLASSCCGVAGSFGFEDDHYDVSMDCGEVALLPAVRAADKDALILTDGFSCREQVQHGTDRRALHLAEVIHLALHQNGHAERYPERPYVETMRFEPNGRAGDTAKWVAAGAFVAAVVSFLLSHRS